MTIVRHRVRRPGSTTSKCHIRSLRQRRRRSRRGVADGLAHKCQHGAEPSSPKGGIRRGDRRPQVCTTVRIVSTNRLPYPLCAPNDSFRQITAGRDARSIALFVGSHTLRFHERPRPRPVVIKRPPHPRPLRAPTEHSAQQEAIHPQPDHSHKPLESPPRQRSVAMPGPEPEQLLRRPHQVAAGAFHRLVRLEAFPQHRNQDEELRPRLAVRNAKRQFAASADAAA